ncbi:hypothetical protein D3C85_1756070 [compost metagenome]
MSIGVVAPSDAQAKRAHIFLGKLAEFFVAAHLPRQPQLSGPEAGGPLDVVRQRVEPILTGFRREFFTELR